MSPMQSSDRAKTLVRTGVSPAEPDYEMDEEVYEEQDLGVPIEEGPVADADAGAGAAPRWRFSASIPPAAMGRASSSSSSPRRPITS
jgi:hypothetical protein